MKKIYNKNKLAVCSAFTDTDRNPLNSRYNFFVEIWCFLLSVSGIPANHAYYNKPIIKDINAFNYTFSFHGFIIILRVNTKDLGDGCKANSIFYNN